MARKELPDKTLRVHWRPERVLPWQPIINGSGTLPAGLSDPTESGS